VEKILPATAEIVYQPVVPAWKQTGYGRTARSSSYSTEPVLQMKKEAAEK
jgi:hypothetical protein